ncbi:MULTISPECIES: 30S ribosomal protein S4 [Thermaerobacter]|uniref:Small ribosomal subunit protein uS4 n=1 Tax=Thermaerobacter subterraneus DSM 13965 TaxID=867903 RepID=K6Q3Q5_9FIRM|nr:MULTISPECIES: 30S ribosomal protein S4 [Thermaerobacter]EKP95724.1 SSU ribosomal protein S4P [Thermaerobacter subterraneus DSM 13965]QIA27296.1 30S ribosomal protein S4 [Thermaerobacter sp. PB12/4term]
MARYTGPKHAMCRRVGRPLCGSPKCPALKRPYPPGQHGPGRRQKLSEYGRRLLEKQKLRFMYGVLERQFRRYFERAQRSKGNTGERLLQLLETRLDNLVYRMGFAPTIWAARQLVVHGHIQVNGRKVDRPSYQVRPGDVIAVREKSRRIPLIQESLENAQRAPEYLSVEPERFQGTLLRVPARDEIPIDIEESLIVEFYSR